MKRPKYDNMREIVIAIFIGAGVSFLTVLFEGLADFLRTNGDSIIAGAASFAYYVAKHYHA